MEGESNRKEVVLTEEQKEGAKKIFEADLKKQKRYIFLAEEFRKAIWDDSESGSNKELFRVIRFCLYKLATRLGPSQEYQAAFGKFDSGDYPD